MGASASVELGPVRSVLDAVSNNAVDEMLGVPRCTQWKVYLWKRAHGALARVPASCEVSGRDRGAMPATPLDWNDPNMWREMTAEEQAEADAKRERKLQDYEDCTVELQLHEEVEGTDGVVVATAFLQALASNRTIHRVYLGMQTSRKDVLLELTRSLSTNSTLRHLELEVCRYATCDGELEAAAYEAIAQSGCLQTLSLTHGSYDDECRLDLGQRIQDALLRNRWAAEIASQLGQVCRLDEFPGSRAKFKCAAFRLCLLSYWLAPSALPEHMMARAVRKPCT